MSNKKIIEKRKKAQQKQQQQRTAVIALIALIALGAIAYAVLAPTSLPLEVSVDEAYELRDGGAFILDVREPNEWEEKHIPGSTLIPLGELEARVNEVPRNQQIVVI